MPSIRRLHAATLKDLQQDDNDLEREASFRAVPREWWNYLSSRGMHFCSVVRRLKWMDPSSLSSIGRLKFTLPLRSLATMLEVTLHLHPGITRCV